MKFLFIAVVVIVLGYAFYYIVIRKKDLTNYLTSDKKRKRK